MSRPVRLFLVSWLLALYGLVSLCGTGLHSFVDATSAHHDHAGGHCDEGSNKSISAANDHCPLCDFQSQGQLSIRTTTLSSRPLNPVHVTILSIAIAATDPHSSGSPRAPPAHMASLI
ncbi:hypothetical protein SAMN05444166_7046 [Singulisphaera sp. GP187]|uniref:hypothetical protein n=1 Tax=Singulisphaera sp. GP187 TaxID=1882752 RepID=UPI00092820BB|nr:hypothetical protein [Singulisphaera sp. GP187]SIO62435.1 hypothetical protein SAMN05444166_7046 [Singulisphaera sp. GP187]